LAATAIDHLVYGVADLDRGISDLAGRTGVRPTPGGRHLGRGTANAILGLGGASYLEVLGPDPLAGPPADSRLAFGIGELSQSRLVGWALRTSELDAKADAMRAQGWDPGNIEEMERETAEGGRLRWRLTVRREEAEVTPFPFLIDWGDTPHPSLSAPAGLGLIDFRVEDPRADLVRRVLAAIGADVTVAEGPETALAARLRTPQGTLVLA
jgi:hypothetical protein